MDFFEAFWALSGYFGGCGGVREDFWGWQILTDNFHFKDIFSTFWYFYFWGHFEPFWPYQTIFGAGMGLMHIEWQLCFLSIGLFLFFHVLWVCVGGWWWWVVVMVVVFLVITVSHPTLSCIVVEVGAGLWQISRTQMTTNLCSGVLCYYAFE